jgi:signal transduction histidine kinase
MTSQGAGEPRPGPGTGTGGGLSRRMAVASVLLALIVGAAFAVLLLAMSNLRTSSRLVTHSREATAAADQLEELVIDLETGVRGFVIAGQERFLEPWEAAREAFPQQARTLERLADRPDQQRRVRNIVRAIAAYITDYSVPLVNDARRGKPAAQSVAATAEGKRRVDALRVTFDDFRAIERGLLTSRQQRDDVNAGRAVVAATIGLAGSVLLILGFGGYLARAIVRPIRRASRLAGQLARGDLATRMPETSTAEIGALERSFNVMAASLEGDRQELKRLADEQAALRRVATLVARGLPPAEVFSAVTRKVGLLSGSDLARMERYETDGTVTGVAGWSGHDAQLAVGTRFALEGISIAALVRQTHGPVRVDSFAQASGPITEEARALGIRSSVGCPIVVAGRLWGVIAASSKSDSPFAEETESQMTEFTELVATAIANAESQAELRASRARIVEASDLTRRRIERDLHDGIQQRLVAVTLGLGAAEAVVPTALGDARTELSRVGDGLTGALDDLREISRGIHPAILAEGGLAPALKTLARRSPIPVDVDVRVEGRLPDRVEVAAYYAVSEMLTNAAKHAQASVVRVNVAAGDGNLRFSVRDDGIGGADPSGGSGLVGLRDRVEALGGAISLQSPRGRGPRSTSSFRSPRTRASRAAYRAELPAVSATLRSDSAARASTGRSYAAPFLASQASSYSSWRRHHS